MSSVSSPAVAAILNKLPFDRLGTKLSFVEFVKMMGLEFDEATQIFKIKTNLMDDLEKDINKLSINDHLILLSEIMNQFIRFEVKWDKTQPEQKKESEIDHTSYTRETPSEALLQKKHSEFEEGLTTYDSELYEKYRKLETQNTMLRIENKTLVEEIKKFKNSAHQLTQTVIETEKYSPPKPTSEKKAHRLAMIERPENMYTFKRIQEESLRKSLRSYFKERKEYERKQDEQKQDERKQDERKQDERKQDERKQDERKQDERKQDERKQDEQKQDEPEITEEEFLDIFVKIWPDPPHAVDTADNVGKFLKENHVDVGRLEVRWNESRGKLERIVEAFINRGAGGKEAALQILQSPDV